MADVRYVVVRFGMCAFPRLLLWAPLVVVAMAAAKPSLASGYWQALQWEYRPLVWLKAPGDDATDWAARLQADRCALVERRIHWLEIRADGSVWRRFAGEQGSRFESIRLPSPAADTVRRKAGWEEGAAGRLLLFGLDGRRKYAGQPTSLDEIWALIDRMPMRRAELQRNPDDCAD